jgi:uncharacterized protein
MVEAQNVSITVGGGASVSGLWMRPDAARGCLVLAHGAGAGMAHKSMTALAEGLAERGIATLRYQFPYMEQGSKRPDPPAVAHRAVRAAVAEAGRLAAGLPLFAGGRSFGGRMTSQAQALSALPEVRGLIFFAFPLHPAGKPSVERAEHLANISIPILFLQGTRDALARLDLLQETVGKLAGATLALLEGADHAFHVPRTSGQSDADVREKLLDSAAEWLGRS